MDDININKNIKNIVMNVPVSYPYPNIDTRIAGEKKEDIKNTSATNPKERSIELLGKDTFPRFKPEINQNRNATDIAIENKKPFATASDMPAIGIKNIGKRNIAISIIQNEPVLILN